MALAATAYHAMAGEGAVAPDLIVGHGSLGRLLARIVVASGAPAPVVWEINPQRMGGAVGYDVIKPEDDPRRDYKSICDVSGDSSLMDSLVGRLARGGELVLAGFYAERLSFNFAPAFMKEARFRIAAEFNAGDMQGVERLLSSGILSLDGLITHRSDPEKAGEAYDIAFSDADCLKMVLNWSAI
jgi:3-hydroxyethyl bacteriochlorophyllide a dehydrogenase